MELDRLKDIKLHGVAKFFHIVFMSLTYPLRHPFRFLTLVVVVGLLLVAVPLTQGMALNNIWAWYKPSQKALIPVNEALVQKPQNRLPYPHVASQPVFEVKPDDSPLLVENNEPALPKQYQPMKLPKSWQMRDEAQTMEAVMAPQSQSQSLTMPEENLKTQLQADQAPQPIEKVESVSEVQPQSQHSYRKLDDLPLVYEQNPKRIRGKAMVFSPNELVVGKTYLFLYGIYTDPQKHDVAAAEQYLTELVRSQRLECDLVAYSYENLPTGVCYIHGRSVNQNMVDAGYADNVAL